MWSMRLILLVIPSYLPIGFSSCLDSFAFIGQGRSDYAHLLTSQKGEPVVKWVSAETVEVRMASLHEA